MENLNKINFFNGEMGKYPKAVKEFCDWIDKYKARVDWNKLFNSDSEYQNAQGKNAPAPKFHDLPLEMQLGIIVCFMEEVYEKKSASDAMELKKCMEGLSDEFKNREYILTNKPKVDPPAGYLKDVNSRDSDYDQ